MQYKPRIYLDNAATSWPKPTAVYEVVDDFQRRLGSSLGRGGYAEADEVSRFVQDTRTAVARLIGAESPDRILFTLNGTDSLNLALHGILKPGDHVVTSVVEHNSILRPLRHLESRYGVEVTRVDCNAFGVVSAEDFRTAIRPRTRLIALSHASNVTGALQPVTEIGKIAHEHGILFLLDAAQTLGHLPLSVSEIGVDLLAAPGHKSLLGPLGTGILYIRSGVEEFVDCVRQGGTGSASSNDEQPTELPDKYESGTHNVLGILGLGAGIEYVERRGPDDIRRHAIELTDLLLAALSDIPGIEAYGPKASIDRVGVVSITIANQDAPLVAKRFEEEFRVQVRGGFQCAALMHRALGTFEKLGTVRFSVGPFNTASDIARATEAARTIAGYRPTSPAPLNCPCVSPVRQQDYGTDAPTLIAPAAREVASTTTAPHSATDVSTIPGMRELWTETLGDPRICIAVLDGPVDLSHPCFQGADIAVHPSSVASPNKGAATQHGTHVASVIFGQHHSDIRGVAPNCHGVIIPVFRDGQDGEVIPCSQIDLARAITVAAQYAKDRGATALLFNISGGQFSPSGEAHPLLNDVVNSLSSSMHLIVSAAGNQGCDCLHIPGALPTVLAVGAMSRDGNPLAFSNWGKSYRAQGILAIGEDVQGATVDHGIELRTGTSYATPIVTGVAALLLSVQLRRTGFAVAERVRHALLSSAVNCEQGPIADCRRLLAGRLDVRSALSTLIDQGTPDMTNDRHLDLPTIEQITSQSHEPVASTVPKPPEARHEDRATPIATPSSGYSVTAPLQGSNMVLPAGCGCTGGNGATMQKVYAIGKLSFDYGTRQRRDYFRNAIGGDPDAPTNLYGYLTKRSPEGSGYAIIDGRPFSSRTDATAITWYLKIDETPVYAIFPQGAFAFEAYDTFLSFLKTQEFPGEGKEKATRMALPGLIAGETTLYTGERVPIVVPDQRGLANWNINALSGAIQNAIPDAVGSDFLNQILDRLHELTRNLGLESRDRAINYAATDALRLGSLLSENFSKLKDMELDAIEVTPSPLCRPGFDCWDVTVVFFNPEFLTKARRAIRYTIDVSDTIPRIVGDGSERAFTLR